MNLPIVLLVEDNPDDAFLTARALEEHNNKKYQLIKVKDGAEALDYIFSDVESGTVKNRPDIILLDLNMPKVSGIEFLRKLRSLDNTFDIPVIVLTSSEEEDSMVECYNLGIKNYITKPFGFEKFILEIKNIGLYRYIFENPR